MLRKTFTQQKAGKRLLHALAGLLLFGSLGAGQAQAQVTFSTGNLTHTEDFTSLGITATAALPSGWRWQQSNAPVFSSGNSNTEQRGGTSGSAAQGLLMSTSTGGTYNFGNGQGNASTERALGFLSGGSTFTITRSIMVECLNSTGLNMTDATISFDYEKYRSGSRAFDWTFYYSTDGSNWTAVPAGNQSYAADAANTTIYNPPAAVCKTGISINGLSVADGSKFYLRWTYTGNGGFTNGQGLGIDNFSITATVSAGTCTSPVQVASFTAPAATPSSIDLAWSAPVSNVLVVAHKGSQPTNAPFSGIAYTAGSELGTSGSGDIVVYAGGASSATISNLVPNAQYYFKSYAFDPTGFAGGTPCYNGVTPATINATTAACLSAQVTGFSATNVQGSFADLSMMVPVGAQVMILKKAGSTAITDMPAQGIAYTVGNAIGASTVAYIGNASPATISGLTTGTQYQLAAFAYDPAGYNSSPCYVTPAAAASLTTTSCNSVTQVTSFSAGTATTYAIPLSWNLAAGNILVLKRKGSAVTGSPVNGTVYTTGSAIGTQDTVIYAGSAGSFAATALVPGTAYYFKAFAYDPTGFTGATPCYNNISAPTVGPATTPGCAGGLQISGLAAQNVQDSSLSLGWALPVGLSIIVLQKTGASAIPASAYPSSGSMYSAGNTTSTGVTVAYMGNAANVALTGLTVGTAYRFEAFAYDPAGYNSLPCYNVNAPAAINVSTAPCDGGQPIASITASNVTTSTMMLNWTAPANQVLILQSAGGPNSNVPANGTIYTVGAMVNTEKVVYVGSGNNVMLSNLQPGTPYNYKAFAYDPTGYTGGTPCYNWLNAPIMSANTAACVASQISSFTASGQTATSVNLGYTIPAGASIIIMMRTGTPIQGDFPQSGTAYAAGQTVGNNTIAYVGNSNTVTLNNLTPFTAYYFAAFAFNPTAYTGNTPCYLNDNFPAVSKTTNACAVPAIAPSNLTFSAIGNNSFKAAWTNGNGGKRIVAINTANAFTTPVDGTDPVANSAYAGSGQQVVYNGSGNEVMITGLSPNTVYYVAVYEASCTDAAVLFNQSPLTGSQSTITTSVITSALGSTTLCAGFPVSVSFTINGAYDAGNVFTAQLSDNSGAFGNPVNIGTLTSATSGTIAAFTPANTTAGAAYRIRVVAGSPSVTGTDNGSDLTINAAVTGNATITQTISGSTDFASQCNAILNITPSGIAPVSGDINVQVTIDPMVQTYNNGAYVQRHYDVTPVTNANTATAAIKLYYSQAEFDAYNAANGTAQDIPTGPADAAGISHLRIMQYHGTSATGMPGSYTGWAGSGPDSVLITPASVNWNAPALRWEVSFSVTGFSGFFVMSNGIAPLPVKLQSFTARADGNNRNRLDWVTALETPGLSFEAERSGDGALFAQIGKILSGAGNRAVYTVYDEQPLKGINYYRLRIIEANGDNSYSNTAVVRSAGSNTGSFTIAPIPAKNQLTVANTDVLLNGSAATITDMHGREIYRFKMDQVTVINTSAWADGIYMLHLASGEVIKIAKQ